MLHDDETQVAEPIDRGSVTPSAKEEKSLFLLVRQVEGYVPEPLHHFILFIISIVPGLTFEGLEIECFGSADQAFELYRAEQLEHIAVTHSSESLIEVVELDSHGLVENVVDDQVDIFMLVLLVDEDGGAALFQLRDDVLAEDVLLDDEGLVEGRF